jgi:XTP/dITP diphosphohydrolase
MTKRLVFATSNAHKVAEVAALLPADWQLFAMRELGFQDEIDEPFLTLQENAAEKCRVLHKALGEDCFAEDTGLFVKQLGGAPGVKSARYSGDSANTEANLQKLLTAMDFTADCSAYFETVAALQWRGSLHFFIGRCPGTIISERRGPGGFGYDPVFVPDGSQKTFAEMSKSEKAAFSHRAKAIDSLVQFLKTQ